MLRHYHTFRHEGLTRKISKRIVEGRKRKGRQRLEYVKQIINVVGCSGYCEIERLAQDRNGWRAASTSLRTADYNSNNSSFINLHRLASKKHFNKNSF